MTDAGLQLELSVVFSQTSWAKVTGRGVSVTNTDWMCYEDLAT